MFPKMAAFIVTTRFLLLGMVLWIAKIQTTIKVRPVVEGSIPFALVKNASGVKTPGSASVMSVFRPDFIGCPTFRLSNEHFPPRFYRVFFFSASLA
jgi:hypothetical protein